MSEEQSYPSGNPGVLIAHTLTSLWSLYKSLDYELRRLSIPTTMGVLMSLSEDIGTWVDRWDDYRGEMFRTAEDAVRDARRYLAEHMEEHLVWEARIEKWIEEDADA